MITWFSLANHSCSLQKNKWRSNYNSKGSIEIKILHSHSLLRWKIFPWISFIDRNTKNKTRKKRSLHKLKRKSSTHTPCCGGGYSHGGGSRPPRIWGARRCPPCQSGPRTPPQARGFRTPPLEGGGGRAAQGASCRATYPAGEMRKYKWINFIIFFIINF